MSTDNQTEYITALVNLHRGLPYKGPGDSAFSRRILDSLTTLPPRPQIADLGCGSGASALLLAQHYQAPVRAVDTSPVFIDELKARAKQAGLEPLIIPICKDMGELNWPAGSVDLLWSEGAVYNLGFEPALKCWRSLLADGGIAVISELSWFTDDAPEPVIAYWQNAYSTMGSEVENMDRASRSGFSVLSTPALPVRPGRSMLVTHSASGCTSTRSRRSLEAVIRETGRRFDCWNGTATPMVIRFMSCRST